jgi:hypothetical protein
LAKTVRLRPYERLGHRLPPLLLIFAEVAKDVADDFYPAEPQDCQPPSGEQRAEAYAAAMFDAGFHVNCKKSSPADHLE